MSRGINQHLLYGACRQLLRAGPTGSRYRLPGVSGRLAHPAPPAQHHASDTALESNGVHVSR
jgi:hypothetical protein